MGETIDLINSHLSETTSVTGDGSMVKVHLAVVAVVAFIVIQFSLSWIYANAKITWLLIATFISTPTKFITFLLLGQVPLRYFGYLDDFPVLNIVKIGCIGGLAFAIPHFIYDVRTPAPESKPLTDEEEYNRKKKGIKLDRALQEKVTFLLVREINQTALVVLIGVPAMRLLQYSINVELFELLVTTAVFGPTIFFVTFISLTGILFGLRWSLQRSRDWWHGWSW